MRKFVLRNFEEFSRFCNNSSRDVVIDSLFKYRCDICGQEIIENGSFMLPKLGRNILVCNRCVRQNPNLRAVRPIRRVENIVSSIKETTTKVDVKKDNCRYLIVSMTSWTKRIHNVEPVLRSILDQTIKPDKVVINLSSEEFPEKENSLPKDLIDLVNANEVLEINWCEKNTGTFKKIIPTLQKYKNHNYYLISIDDDNLYSRNYIEFLLKEITTKDVKVYCASNVIMSGGLMIYDSSIFDEKMGTGLTDKLIELGVDDSYYYKYITNYKKLKCEHNSSKPVNLIKSFNPIYPNSRTKSRKYDPKRLAAVEEELSKIDYLN